MEASIVSHIPLASAVVWSAIGVSQARGGSFRVSTGAAFIATAVLMATYALWDWLGLVFGLSVFMTIPLPPSRFFLVLASLTFLYFAKWLVHGKRWVDGLVALPAAFMALPYTVPWIPYLSDIWLASDSMPMLAEAALTHYLLYTLTLILAGIQLLRQGALLALDAMGRESWAIVAIMGAASLMLAFSILTNPYFPVLQESVTPLYSSTLVAPGAMLLAALRRGRGIGVLQLFNLREVFKGETLAVYLIYKTGDLLGAALAEGQRMDDDVFVGTFEAFQRFFTHALPFLQGHALKTATFGDIAVIIERGGHCYLTVVTTSKRLGLIRDLMRQRLRRFEDENSDVLQEWSGVVDVLRNTDKVLHGFVPEELSEEMAAQG
ncbi:MAG: hypothetical protein ACE5HJ_01450 [Thermoplasmata archaeon]